MKSCAVAEKTQTVGAAGTLSLSVRGGCSVVLTASRSQASGDTFASGVARLFGRSTQGASNRVLLAEQYLPAVLPGGQQDAAIIARYTGAHFDSFDAEISSVVIPILSPAARALAHAQWELRSYESPASANDPAGFTRTLLAALTIPGPTAPPGVVFLQPDPSRRRVLLSAGPATVAAGLAGDAVLLGSYTDAPAFPLYATGEAVELRHTQAVTIVSALAGAFDVVALVERQ